MRDCCSPEQSLTQDPKFSTPKINRDFEQTLRQTVPDRVHWCIMHGLSSLLFSSCIFLSAFLLFLVQPLIGKSVLPLLGGTPQVWNACLLFFQGILLAGYFYAHLVTQKLSVKISILLHLVLTAAVLLMLPIQGFEGNSPASESHPILWLLLLLAANIGIPFFILCANSPLTQRWFSLISKTGKDPYFLYAASNTGSLAALMAYPFAVEPWLKLHTQRNLWSLGFVAFSVVLLVCSVLTLTLDKKHQTGNTQAAAQPALPFKQKLFWLFLAFTPSSLMYGVTTYLSTDIAAFPLLWIIPLGLYLLTFIIAFSRFGSFWTLVSKRLFPAVVIPLVVILAIGPKIPMKISIFWNFFSFFALALFCHGTLSNQRPAPTRLTEFYLCLSLGGVLGGVFNALLAPVLFPWPIEYQIAIIFACLLRTDRAELKTVLKRWLHGILPLSFGIFLIATFLFGLYSMAILGSWRGGVIFLGSALITVLLLLRQKGRFALSVSSLFFIGILFFINPNVEYSGRSFFGVHRIKTNHKLKLRSYLNGSVIHGTQSLDPELSKIPSTYYHPTGPAGDILKAYRNLKTSSKAAFIGLGIGSMAAYGVPGDVWTFYEIDPLVKKIAENSKYFTYLSDSKASYQIILGDGRIQMAKAADHAYGLILIDAFSSDSIPVHLITQEALKLYLQKLADPGILAFHISNQYLDLAPVLTRLAESVGLTPLVRKDLINEQSEENLKIGKKPSVWVLMIRKPSDLGLPNVAIKPQEPTAGNKSQIPLWTDNYSNIVRVMRWK